MSIFSSNKISNTMPVVDVLIRSSPVVINGNWTLDFRVKNESKIVVRFINIKNDDCFLSYYVSTYHIKNRDQKDDPLSLIPPTCKKKIKLEEISIKPGRAFSREVNASRLLINKLDIGRYLPELTCDFTQMAKDLKLKSPYDISAATNLDFVVPAKYKDYILKRDVTVKLGTGSTIQLIGHSHKRTSPGQRSPTLAEVYFKKKSTTQKVYSTFSFYKLGELFDIDDEYFQVLKSDYDVSITVRHMGKIP